MKKLIEAYILTLWRAIRELLADPVVTLKLKSALISKPITSPPTANINDLVVKINNILPSPLTSLGILCVAKLLPPLFLY